MEYVMRLFVVPLKELFQEDLNEFVSNDNKVFVCYLMELSNQWRYLLQENDRRHWKKLD
jgi:hypothetical protein